MRAARFTKELRQKIIRAFAIRHNGQFNPRLFLDEVRRKGKKHPAYAWFQWDADRAATEYQLWQAREFAQGLKVTFTVEKVGRNGPMKLVTAEMPLVLSAREGRRDGGGYVLTDPSDGGHMAEYCHQAGAALQTWLNRYRSAVIHIAGSVETVEALIASLDSVSAAKAAA